MKITAFNVMGDSFLLEKSDNGRNVQILIDGGNCKGFDKLVKKYLRKNQKLSLDLMVCTHLDSDHSTGLISLLKNKEVLKKCNEIWLPVLWADAIIKMLRNDTNYIKKLLKVIKSQSNSFKNLDDVLQEVEHVEDYQGYYLNEIKDLSLFYNDFNHNELICRMIHRDEEIFELFFSLTGAEHKKLISTMKKLTKLTQLIDVLNDRKIPIVWFDLKDKKYSEWEKDNRLLIPLCHEEIASYRRKVDYSSIYCLIPQPPLKEINKRSLVVASKESSSQLSIFSADSNFEHINQAQLDHLIMDHGVKGIIFTVPHHGSHSSSDAILKLNKSIKNTTYKVKWIRGKNPSSFTLSPYYTNLIGSRYCLKCHIWNKRGKKEGDISPKLKGRRQKEREKYITFTTNRISKVKKCVCHYKP